MGHSYHILHGMNFTALRFFSVYGPRARPDMMPFMVTDAIARQQAITLFDNGQMKRDWTYVDDNRIAEIDFRCGRIQAMQPYSMHRQFCRRGLFNPDPQHSQRVSGRDAILSAQKPGDVRSALSDAAEHQCSVRYGFVTGYRNCGVRDCRGVYLKVHRRWQRQPTALGYAPSTRNSELSFSSTASASETGDSWACPSMSMKNT